METARLGEHEKKLFHRLLSDGMDEAFLKRWFDRYADHGIEEDLKSAAEEPSLDNYEELLESWIETAREDYHHWYIGSGHVQAGDIPPRKAPKKQRAYKPKDVAGVWERQKALAHYLEEVASEEREVVRFRERAMSGRLLSQEEALAFLSSPLLADQQLSVLVRNGISLLHASHLLEEEADERGPYKKLIIEGWEPWIARPLGAKGPELIYPGDVLRLQDARGLREVGAIYFPHPREEDRLVIAREGSVIAALFRLAENRLGGYPISPEMAVWFILTGEFDPQYPVRMRYMRYRHREFSRTTITLEVESWLPPEEILEQYRHAQHEILGGTPRSLKRKTVALFEFVNQHKGASWGKLFGAWNKAHPSQSFRDRSHLFTTYMRALEYIAGVKPTKDNDGSQLSVAGTDSHGFPIYAEKWYLLHEGGYTGTFDSPEEALADPRSEKSEILASEELVVRLAERAKNN
jgi:hypothetical protein